MRIYFSAALPCVLRAGGAPAGFLNGNKLFADADRILAEFLPADGDLLPLSFVTGEEFFRRPPACCDVYRCGCYNVVHAARFSSRRSGFDAKTQIRCGNLQATVFECGGPFLCVQNAEGFEVYPLPQGEYTLGETHIGGALFLHAYCEKSGYFVLADEGCRRVLRERIRRREEGETLLLERALPDIAGHTVRDRYELRGGELVRTEREVFPREGFDPATLPETLFPFAFFEELAAGGDPAPFLSPALGEQAEKLSAYLGDFCGVCVPEEVFYRIYGKINAVGLIYARAENSFDVKFFRTQTQDGKISNILPADE